MVELDLGVAGGGGSGFVFTRENLDAGYMLSTNTGGIWLLEERHLLEYGAHTTAGDEIVPLFNGIDYGNGHARITFIGSSIPEIEIFEMEEDSTLELYYEEIREVENIEFEEENERVDEFEILQILQNCDVFVNFATIFTIS